MTDSRFKSCACKFCNVERVNQTSSTGANQSQSPVAQMAQNDSHLGSPMEPASVCKPKLRCSRIASATSPDSGLTAMVLPCYFLAPVVPQVPTELKATDCAFVSVQMDKTLDVALLDTGAAYSILRASYSALVDATLDSKLTLAAANGSHIRVYGRARVSIKIGIKMVVHVFYVADVVHNILGADLIKAHDIVISLAQNRVTIQGQEVAIVNMAIPMPRCRCQCHDQPGVAATVDTLYPGQLGQAPQAQHPPLEQPVSATDVYTPTYIYPTVFPEPAMVPGPVHTYTPNSQMLNHNSQPMHTSQAMTNTYQPTMLATGLAYLLSKCMCLRSHA